MTNIQTQKNYYDTFYSKGGWKYINEENGRFFDSPTIQHYMEYGYSLAHVESLTSAIQEVLLLDNRNISNGIANFPIGFWAMPA